MWKKELDTEEIAEPAIMSLGNEETVFVIDLIRLKTSEQLKLALEEFFKNKERIFIGHNFE